MEDPRRALQLGALLRDVGDFVAMAASRTGAAAEHSVIGANWLHAFVEVGLPEEVAALPKVRAEGNWDEMRRDSVSLAIYHADRMLRGTAAPDPNRDETPELTSIFSLVGGKQARVSADADPAALYPSHRVEEPDAATLVAVFGETIRRWVHAGCHADPLLSILERYWARVPSERDGETGIPLFDKARLTCALASALYGHFAANGAELTDEPTTELAVEALPSETEYLAIVAGRLVVGSDFVERHVAQGDVCTSLGRAFFVRLLAEHVADDILGRLGLCAASAMYRTDTEFVLLCPNVPALPEAIQAATERTNRWLLATFGPAIHWAIASTPAAPPDLVDGKLPAVLTTLDHSLAQQEARPYGKGLADALTQAEPTIPDGSCEVCGTDMAIEFGPLSTRSPDIKACTLCQQFSEIGSDLLGSMGVSVETTESPDQTSLLSLPRSDGTWARYRVVKGDAPPGSVRYQYVFADAAPASQVAGDARLIFHARYIRSSAHVPKSGRTGDRKRRHEVASLRALAKSSRGAAYLGVLRVDVDETFGRVWGSATDLRRFATLSRMISRFFDVNVPAICASDLPKGMPPRDVSEKSPDRGTGRNVTLIRSSGDDLLLVGAWDEVAEVTIDIRECFRRYTAGGALDVSASVVVGEPEAPLLSSASTAAHGLTVAKAHGGGRCAMFHDRSAATRDLAVGSHRHPCHTWDQVLTAIMAPVQSFKMTGRILQNRFEAYLPQGFIPRLLNVVATWEREGALYLPQMAHLVKELRSGPRGDVREVQRLLMDTSKMPGLRAAAVWLDLLSG